MTTLRQAAEQALISLERADKISGHANNKATIATLRQALEADTKPCACCGDGNSRLSVTRICDTCGSEYAGQAEMDMAKRIEAEQQAEQATWYHKHWGEGDDIFYLPTDAIPDGATPLYTRPQPQSAPWPTSLVDKVIKALSEYCETGEIGCADDLLAAICYEMISATKKTTRR